MHGLYLPMLLLQSRMQADSVILPISNVAQTTQTLSSLSGRFNRFAKNQLKKLNSRPTIEDPQEKCLGKILKLTFKMSN